MAAEGENVTGEKDKSDDQQPDAASIDSFTIEALLLIKEAQQQHGLRHGDYQRYRSYCSRRIRRIRKSLHFPQGARNRVAPKKVTVELLTDSRYIQLPLFCAERCWAYAMQLKSEANTEPRKRFHMASRLKKAVQYADELAALCESPKCDARTKLECQAYNAWIHGSLQFEFSNWEKAMEYFTKAKTIYEKLAGAFTEEQQAVYQQRVDEIAPNLRYCAYNIGDESALQDLQKMRIAAGGDQLSSKLDDLLSQTREKQATTLSEVTWRGRTVQVKVETVRLFLLSMADADRELQTADTADSKISIYETLLKQCIEAQQALRDSLQEDTVFKAAIRGQQIEGKITNQHYLYSYLTYLRLKIAVERNLHLIENLRQYLPDRQVEEGRKITKPQDLVRLYDIIIQNLGDIPNLPGVEEDPTLSEEIAVRVSGYKAFRLFYIARAYTSAKKWTEAIALYERTLEYAKTAVQGYTQFKSKDAFYQLEASRLAELRGEIQGMMYSCHANSILDVNQTDREPATSTSATITRKSLGERLDDYVEDRSLVGKKPFVTTFPPDFQPIPCRPLFFDLALNHVHFPALDDKLEQTTKKAAGGGLTGFVKGWLWGGGDKK
ncbi:signal recognition particle subunit SRP68-like [Babylonia areolata]|uniref:signal recognition particle subunit SRP68-like n=1 Tax=Babylonia areolata TaxID=304850 RepID=UPI003FD6960B